MAKRTYLSNYKDSDRRGMTVYMPDVVKGGTDLSPEASQQHRILSAVLATPSLDNLYSRYKHDDEFNAPLPEYPAELAKRKEKQEQRAAEMLRSGMLKNINIKRRKEKGYDFDELKRRKILNNGVLEDDELAVIALSDAVVEKAMAVKKAEKILADLEKEIADEKSMATSFDRRTRRLYDALKVQNMEADLQKVRDNIDKMRVQHAAAARELKWFTDPRPQSQKGRDPTLYQGHDKGPIEKPKKKVILVRKPKTVQEAANEAASKGLLPQ